MGKRYSEEQIERAKNMSILEYAQTHGYNCKKAGREYHITGYGGLYVKPENNSFYNHSQEKGGYGCISFVQQMEGVSFLQAMETLVGEPAEEYDRDNYEPKKSPEKPKSEYLPKEYIPPEPDEKPIVFEPPSMDEKSKYAYGYLTGTRGLDISLINDFVKQGVLYQTTSNYTDKDSGKEYYNHNIVFLHIDENGEPCGASLQGTRSDRRFKQNMTGTVNDFGYVYNKGTDPDTVYLFEAPIDMMSFVQLHPEIENAKFVAMEGLKPTIAEHYINSGYMVISCVDNDKAGKSFNNRILNDQMQKAFGGQSVKLTVDDRKPPIEYLEAENNGNKITLFLSEDDYRDYKDIKGCTSGRCFIWKNESNYQLNNELVEYGVKDFNDLLKLRKGNARESKSEIEGSLTIPFSEKLDEVVEIAGKIEDAIDSGVLNQAQQREAEQDRGQAR